MAMLHIELGGWRVTHDVDRTPNLKGNEFEDDGLEVLNDLRHGKLSQNLQECQPA